MAQATMKAKRFGKTFLIVKGGARHGMRGEASEHVAMRRGKVTFAEAFCGRMASIRVPRGIPKAVVEKGSVDCGGCLSAMAARA